MHLEPGWYIDAREIGNMARYINHSCDPNIVIEWDDDPNEPLKANVKAVRPIEIGEELSFSYIDCNLPYEERQFKLRDYGFVCQCNKCKVESMRVGD